MSVLLGRHTSGLKSEQSGGDHERPIGAGERIAECLNGASVGVGGALEVSREGEVVLEGEMDHAI